MQAEVPATTIIKEGLIGILQSCRQSKDLSQAKRLHAYLLEHNLELHPVVGNYLVPMLVECGSLPDARRVFDTHPHLNQYSWNSLISGYIAAGLSPQAFHLYHKMVQQAPYCLRPNRCTYLSLLNACAKLKDAQTGLGLHSDIVKGGLERDLFNDSPVVGNTLVDVYGKCDLLAEALRVFYTLPVRDVVSWNALVVAYTEQGLNEEARNCFQMMQSEGISPSSVTFLCSLRACGSIGNVETGHEIHTDLAKRGQEKDFCMADTLVDAYSKCGALREARHVFDTMGVRDAVSWASLIAGYTEHGLGKEAGKCIQQMQLEGVNPDSVNFVCSLKACAITGALDTGQEINTELAKRGLDGEPYVCNTLVDMYTKCGLLADAHQIFDKMSAVDAISWNAMIAGYTEQGLDERVLNYFKEMQRAGVSADPVTFMYFLKACGTAGAFETVCKIHGEVIKRGFENTVHMANTLVDVYIKCSSLAEAWQVFDRLRPRDVVSWNALIAAYAEHGRFEEVGNFFQEMQQEHIPPDAVTFVSSLRACATLEGLETGKILHAEVTKRGLETEVIVGNTLLDIYTKCGSLREARQVFDKLPDHDTVSWAALVTGYAEHGLGEEAKNCIRQMQLDGILPDPVTIICSLRACSTTGDLDTGREINAEIIKRGLEGESFVGNTVVGMYTKCRSLVEAQQVFDKLPVPDAVSWNALIVGYSEHENDEKVLGCFKQMQLAGVPFDPVTLVCTLKACGIIGVLEMGHEIDTEIRKLGLEKDPSVGSMLVEMYGRCSSVPEGREVFDKLPVRDVVTWTAMIKAYGENHEGSMAVQCFEDMQQKGVKPDPITFTCLLAACSHASLVVKGEEYFKVMREHEIEPTSDHYACMVDLFARSGRIYKAERFVAAMECPPSSFILMALLTACKLYSEVELGQRCFQQLVELNQDVASACLLMAEMYASACRWSDANCVEKMRKNAGAKKKPGSAIIEVNAELHEFIVGVNRSQILSQVLETVNSHVKEEGYVPNSLV